jgi:octanoyl-[GcvH]:protein N-octanoyltransferase
VPSSTSEARKLNPERLVSGEWYLSTVQILITEHLEDPEDGFGLQQAVLEEVAAGERGLVALIWTSSRYIGVTRPEMRRPGFEEAIRAAKELGFPVLVRNSGGGAVAAIEDLRHGLYERYVEAVDLVAAALRRVGVEAEGGEVEGEFCPGAHSVRSGGPREVKHAGLAQRVTRRAARVEALILVSGTGELVPVLERFYGALDLPFRPESVGDLPAGVAGVIAALVVEVRERYGGEEISMSEVLLKKARSHREKWRITPTRATPRGRG